MKKPRFDIDEAHTEYLNQYWLNLPLVLSAAKGIWLVHL